MNNKYKLDASPLKKQPKWKIKKKKKATSSEKGNPKYPGKPGGSFDPKKKK